VFLARRPFPREHEIRRVRGVDVRQARVLRSALVAAVVGPVLLGRRGPASLDPLGARHDGRRSQGGERQQGSKDRFGHEDRMLRIIIRAMRTTASVLAGIAGVCALWVTSVTLSSQAQTIRIHAGTVIDGTGKAIRNATIVVSGSKISAIETGSA